VGLPAACRRTRLSLALQRQVLLRGCAGLNQQALGIPTLPAVVDGARIVGGLRVAELDVPQVPGVRALSASQKPGVIFLVRPSLERGRLCRAARRRAVRQAARHYSDSRLWPSSGSVTTAHAAARA